MSERIGVVEKARITDAKAIQRLVNYFAGQDLMLYRALDDTEKDIGDYYVYRNNGMVEGCGALHVLEAGRLAEIRAMAVWEES